MKVGELGVVVLNGDRWPNPIGMSVEVTDDEMALAVLTNPDVANTPPLNSDGNPNPEFVVKMTALGVRLATRKARAIMQLVGLDIADTPISVKPALILPDRVRWHVLTAIIAIAEQPGPRRMGVGEGSDDTWDG